ncbi:HSP40/DnaJ peptide-binding protein [Abeliophyllum distichum]|uniref:HSP40/DnaJ peptide-binding protein n=1 Tax=Abeliophyllum distichum TaxID=126358 RepID=A0ABD1TKS1_9LAMI
MAEHSSRSYAQDFHHFLRLGRVCRACKSFVSSCYPDKNNASPKKAEIDEKKPKSIEEDDFKSPKSRNSDEEVMHDSRLKPHGSPKSLFKHKSSDKHFKSSPLWSPPVSRSGSHCPLLSRSRSHCPLLSRSTSRNQTSAATGSHSKSMSRRNSVDGAAVGASLSRISSRRKGSTPIMYSNSNGLIKPPSIEQQLECTLEELCFGCIKKIKIIRDAVTYNGQIIEEDEVLTVKVKPGWTKGTQITFEGMGNETPGTYPADVTFIVAEKGHPLFIREGDDLHLMKEIPLVKALTGCNISVPLLGGQEMNLKIDDIIYHGYEMIVQGQGMAMQKESGKRGDLLIKFLVKFPVELTNQQRSDVVNILMDDC